MTALDYGKKMCDTMIKTHPDVLSRKWDYDEGLVLLGMSKIYEKCGEKKYFDYIKKSMDFFINEDGTINTYSKDNFNIDAVNNGRVVLYLYKKTGEEKYKKAIELLKSQVAEQPRTKCGSFWHKLIYPNQIWLDGLYMGQPFRAEIGGEGVYEDIYNQFVNVLKYTYEPEKDLYVHAYDEDKVQIWADKVTGRAPNAWGRALGWLVMAFTDVLEYMPKTFEKYDEMVAMFKETIDKILKCQTKEGVWKQVVDSDREENYKEASASCMIAYALNKGVNNGWLGSEYKEVADKAYNGVISEFVKVEDESVLLSGVCQVAGLGGPNNRDGSFEYYMSEPVVINDFKGTGGFIHMCAELA